MARVLEVIVPPGRVDRLAGEVRTCAGLLTLRVQRGAALQPPGDVLTLETTNDAMIGVLRVLQRHGLGEPGGLSATTSQPVSLIPSGGARAVLNDSSEAAWEEMECVLARESNMTANAVIVMAVAGVLAVVGIATNALHLVVAAMAIAPGFEPLLRVPLALVAGNGSWRNGLLDLLKGYAALMLGAAAAAAAMPLSPLHPSDEGGYLATGALLSYWTSVTATSVAASAAAALAGAILVSTNRSVLTAGVMIALALVPTAALVGAGLVIGDFALAGRAAVRWLIDATLVVGMAALLFAWKRWHVLQRPTSLH